MHTGNHRWEMLECHLQTKGNRPCLLTGREDGEGETSKGGPLRQMTGMGDFMCEQRSYLHTA